MKHTVKLSNEEMIAIQYAIALSNSDIMPAGMGETLKTVHILLQIEKENIESNQGGSN